MDDRKEERTEEGAPPEQERTPERPGMGREAFLDPNPGWLDQESHMRILATVAGIGLLGWVIGYLSGDLMLTFMATFLAVYSAFMIVSVTDVPFLGPRVEAFIEEWVREEGKFSFYGLMAATYFVKWEVELLIQEIRTFELTTDNLIGTLITRVLGFSLETLMNALSTLIWPVHAFTEYTLIPAIIVVAICWGLVRLGARAFFTPEWMLEAEAGPQEGKEPEGEEAAAGEEGPEKPEGEAVPERKKDRKRGKRR